MGATKPAITRRALTYICRLGLSVLVVLGAAGMTTKTTQPKAKPKSSPKTAVVKAAQKTTRREPSLINDTLKRASWQIPHNARVNKHIKLWSKSPTEINRILTNATPYFALVLEQIDEHDLPVELAFLPMIESGYSNTARSPVGAQGMWQIMPATARYLGLKNTTFHNQSRDAITATQAGLKYLAYLNKRFKGDWLLALAAYNCGEGNVNKAIKRNRKAGKPTDYWSLPLPKETKEYVPKLLGLIEVLKNPDRYPMPLKSIPDSPVLAKVHVPTALSLKDVAKMAGATEASIYKLNPGFHKTMKAKVPFTVLLPHEKAIIFQAAVDR